MYVDFGAIVKRSFDVAWNYKSLWIFGLFAGGAGSFNTNWSPKSGSQDLNMDFAYDIFDYLHLPYDFIPPEMAVIGAILLWVLALGLLFFICYLIAQPALIDGVNKITRGGQYRFGTSFSAGTKFFWRFFGLSMVTLFCTLVLIGIVILFAVILTPFSLLLTIPAAIVVAFLMYHTFGLAEVAMVARDSRIGDAIAEGWNLLMTNKANCFLLSLILIGLGIGFGLVFGLAALLLYLPINLLIYALTESLVGIFLLAIFIGLPVALVLGGYSGTFFNALYVQFYFRLVEPPQPVAQPSTAPMA